MSSFLGGALDIGTNSVKILVADRDCRGEYAHFELGAPCRLGEGMQRNRGALREDAMLRTLDALGSLLQQARAAGMQQVHAVGTSALREASNREQFLELARSRLQLDIEVVSGEEEARLSFLAVSIDPLWKQKGALCVLDIGGGSTEVIFGAPNGEMEQRVSIRMGALTLSDRYLGTAPAPAVRLAEARQAAAAAFEHVTLKPEQALLPLIGVGGTISTLAGMERGGTAPNGSLHGWPLAIEAVERQLHRLVSATMQQRMQFAGLSPQRADIIPGGAVLLAQAMESLGANTLQVSLRGLRWGLWYDRYLISSSGAEL